MPLGTFYKPKFFEFMMEEYLACLEGVGIIDMSSFSKMLLKVSTRANSERYNLSFKNYLNQDLIRSKWLFKNKRIGLRSEEFRALFLMNFAFCRPVV